MTQFTVPHSTETLVKLLRAIAGGDLAKSNRHDVILNAAADRLVELAGKVENNILYRGPGLD